MTAAPFDVSIERPAQFEDIAAPEGGDMRYGGGTMVDQRRSEIAKTIGAIAQERAAASEDALRNIDETAINNKLMMGLATEEDRALSGDAGRRRALIKRIFIHADALQRSLRDWPSAHLDDFDPNDPGNPWPL